MNYLNESLVEPSNSQLNISVEPGLYEMNKASMNNTIVYPFASTIIMQKEGASSVDKNKRTDLESELFNITRANSNDPFKKYIPNPNHKLLLNHNKDSDIPIDHTRLSNNIHDIKGMTINRFLERPLDLNVLKENRIGNNTHLGLVDNYQSCG